MIYRDLFSSSCDEFSAGTSSGYGAIIEGYTSSTTALYINQGRLRWASVSWSEPPGTSTQYLRADGTWGTPSVSSAVTSVSASSSSSGLSLTASPTTGAVNITLSGTPSLSSNSNALGGLSASSWARTFPCDSGTANAAGSGINFISLITGVQFRGTSNIIYVENVSDKRLKENITPETLGLEFINKLKPVTFNLLTRPRRQHGFIADDFESLIDHNDDALKTVNPDGIKGIDYISLIAPLVKAIQELTQEVNILKQKVG